ncbi:L,D-transpeptidase [Aminobacter sp. NyZ550]|jgi:lipoprotein-anchoring transpeptidase ErfK/SrfK|uniref:ErfK/YbiS/YcfS/YnhG family protein n=3 Tax=Aminobacter TaxID=31988 RepID=A0AAC9ARU4_AMIAI|nr:MULTISPECIES: L,D-transpeptidase [Aminobacter]AMS42718.1 ErfK/YbiS/YcfS/YnhG family protein [Aminobacter aminovorans]MRX34988.1 L,D-transpeptidase family protein [Aminobacter sp. MDW-2]QNH32780.1 L,D-transpeptidase [Aminobacter sp. MDW-2]WAX93717.1 L,D-transpeptidase [Aminobacter sp. NyZ550]BBD37772.1 ErfK/YbiS/YcfS/YnhG family protein [Aminobacter sp. SS-2016]
MQLRRILLAGLCATFMSSTAFAATSAGTVAAPQPAASDVITVAAKSDAAELKLLKKKKKPTDEDLSRIKDLEAKIKADKEVARLKMLEAKKMAMRAAAKAKAEQARELARLKKSEKATAQVATASAPAPKRDLQPLAVMKPIEPLAPDVAEVASAGNNGELRSESQDRPRQTGLLAGIFGGSAPQQSMLPQTRALDAVLQAKQAKKQFKVKSDFEPQEVSFSGYERGQIVVDTGARYLYLIESSSTARRYAIAVGREGLEFKGKATIGDKQEWPRWIPTKEMQEREPKKYGQYKDGMNGGPENPLGARAIYLYQGKKDTHIRIHGTNQPQTIGTNSSNGCFRMVNDHVMDLYNRVRMGSEVIVM